MDVPFSIPRSKQLSLYGQVSIETIGDFNSSAKVDKYPSTTFKALSEPVFVPKYTNLLPVGL